METVRTKLRTREWQKLTAAPGFRKYLGFVPAKNFKERSFGYMKTMITIKKNREWSNLREDFSYAI